MSIRSQSPHNSPRVRAWTLVLLAIAAGLAVVAVASRDAATHALDPKAAANPTRSNQATKPTETAESTPFVIPDAPAAPANQPLAYLEPGVGPITYYHSICASCHGSYGSYYYENDILAEGRGNYQPDGLLSQVRLMLSTNAHVELPEPLVAGLAGDVSTFPDVAADTTAVDGPFVAVVGWSDGPDGPVSLTPGPGLLTLRGEVTPESTVTVLVGGTPISATIAGHAWFAQLESPSDPGQIEVVAKLGQKEAHLHLDKGAFAVPQ